MHECLLLTSCLPFSEHEKDEQEKEQEGKETDEEVMEEKGV